MISLLFAALLQTAPASDGWEYKETANAQTGARAASAVVRDADSGARLVVRCDAGAESIVSVQFLPKPPLAAGTSRIVTLTLDNAKAEMASWDFPGRGAFVGDPVTTFIYAEAFAKAKTIEIGMDGDAGQAIGAIFKGPGGDAMFRKVFAACGREYAMPSVTAAN